MAKGKGKLARRASRASEHFDIPNRATPARRARRASEGGGAADPRPLRLLYCGQLIERKGVDLLLRAFEQLAGEFPALELTLVGQGPLGERMAAGLPDHLRARVTFAGFQPLAELPGYFAAAEVFVLPSRHDGWGVVVNQAIAAGLPVICNDAVGAACDLVSHFQNGLELDPALEFDAAEAAAQIQMLMDLAVWSAIAAAGDSGGGVTDSSATG